MRNEPARSSFLSKLSPMNPMPARPKMSPMATAPAAVAASQAPISYSISAGKVEEVRGADELSYADGDRDLPKGSKSQDFADADGDFARATLRPPVCIARR